MRRWAWPVTCVVLAVALIGGGVQQGLSWDHTAGRATEARAAVSAAEREVLALISVSAATSTRDLARLRAGATGAFKSELAQESSTFTSSLRDSEVSSTGTIVSSGLTSLSGKQATVVLAATGTVRNKTTKTPSARSYQMRAELTRTGGHWLVSSLEFVS